MTVGGHLGHPKERAGQERRRSDDQLLAWVEQGYTHEQIDAMIGRHRETVGRWLHEAGWHARAAYQERRLADSEAIQQAVVGARFGLLAIVGEPYAGVDGSGGTSSTSGT